MNNQFADKSYLRVNRRI